MNQRADGLPEWLLPCSEGVRILVLAVPRASRSEIAGPHGSPPRLRVRICAPPVDGEANSELTSFLAKRLGVPRSRVRIERGESSKRKDVLAEGVDVTEALSALGGR